LGITLIQKVDICSAVIIGLPKCCIRWSYHNFKKTDLLKIQ